MCGPRIHALLPPDNPKTPPKTARKSPRRPQTAPKVAPRRCKMPKHASKMVQSLVGSRYQKSAKSDQQSTSRPQADLFKQSPCFNLVVFAGRICGQETIKDQFKKGSELGCIFLHPKTPQDVPKTPQEALSSQADPTYRKIL